MNYERVYSRFIQSRKAKEGDLIASGSYTEAHHIVPVALGGNSQPDNLIRLSAREHYFAHCCLAKAHGGKMWSALFAVANMTKVHASASYFLRGRMVAVARAKAAQQRSRQMMVLWRSGEFKRHRVYGPIAEAHKEKLRLLFAGRKPSLASIEKRTKTRSSSAKRFEFHFVESGEIFCGTQCEFSLHSGISQSLASCLTRGKIISAKGWMLFGGNPLTIRNRDGVLRTFHHKNGETFTGTSYQFRTKYDFDAGVISNLINGKNRVKSFKGWKYAGHA